MRMHRAVVLVGICTGSMLALMGLAQTKKKTVEIPVVEARAEDVGTIEAIVKADYECISGGVGVPRQWGRDLSLYAPGAGSFTPYKDAKSGEIRIWSASEQEYANTVDAEFVKEGFVERELAHKINRFGNVATVFSSYEGKMTSTRKLESRGVNVYQVCFDGKRWWIVSVSWDGVNPVNAIPPELEPRG